MADNERDPADLPPWRRAAPRTAEEEAKLKADSLAIAAAGPTPKRHSGPAELKTIAEAFLAVAGDLGAVSRLADRVRRERPNDTPAGDLAARFRRAKTTAEVVALADKVTG